jgi:transcription antitermination factor NusG
MSSWYAVQALTGQEQSAVTWMRDRFQIETLLPLSRQRKRRLCQNHYVVRWIERPYFPGYFFVHRPHDFRVVNDTPGVIRILGTDQPLPVQQDFIDRLRAAMNPYGIVGTSALRAGMQAHLIDCLLGSQTVEIVQDVGRRVHVMLEILGAVRAVNVRAENVEV